MQKSSSFERTDSDSMESKFIGLSERVYRSLQSIDALESNEKTRSLCLEKLAFLDQQKCLCVLLNSKAEIVYLNEYGCDLLAIEPFNYYGSCWLTQFVLPEQRTEMVLVFEQMMLGNGDAYADYCNEVYSYNQATLPFAWKSKVLRNSEGFILGVFSQGCELGCSA